MHVSKYIVKYINYNLFLYLKITIIYSKHI
jgi:hypothetical protein